MGIMFRDWLLDEFVVGELNKEGRASPWLPLGVPIKNKTNKQFAVRDVPRSPDIGTIYHNPRESHNNFPRWQTEAEPTVGAPKITRA
jgi:hypothetical protein